MKNPFQTPRFPFAALALGLALASGSCGASDPVEAGFDALQAQQYDQAVRHLEQAIAEAEPGSDAHREVVVGYFQAKAHVSAEACRKEFLSQIDAQQVAPTERDFETVAGELMQVKAFSDAAHVIDRGIKTYPENSRLPEFMDKLTTMAKQSDQAELASTIKGLGYGGGD